MMFYGEEFRVTYEWLYNGKWWQGEFSHPTRDSANRHISALTENWPSQARNIRVESRIVGPWIEALGTRTATTQEMK